MTDAKAPDAAAATDAVDEIVEVIFEDHYMLAVAAFIAGALLIAAVVYIIGSRNVASEGESDAAN